MGMLRAAGAALLVAACLAALVPPPAAAATLHARASAQRLGRQEAVRRLHQALQLPGGGGAAPGGDGGSDGSGGQRARREAPEFMMQLQRRIAHPDGVLRHRQPEQLLPHGARVVRSFLEQEPASDHLLQFNISVPDAIEKVLGAELRIYRVRRPRVPLLLRVYQAEAGRALDAASADQHRLLGVQAARAGASAAWHVFNVLPAVRSWLEGAPNLGLLVTATTLDGSPAPRAAAAIARRGGRHAPRKQPLLVLYDGERGAQAGGARAGARHGIPDFSPPLSGNELDDPAGDDYDDDYSSAEDGAERSLTRARRSAGESPGASRARGRRRQRREGGDGDGGGGAGAGAGAVLSLSATDDADAANASAEYSCTRRDLYVDFADIGWDSWLLAPQGYNAYQCAGSCPYPLGPASQPTNHATVQSIMRQLRQDESVAAPCCTPLSLLGLSIMFADEDTGEIVLKVYEDMVADRCGCQ